MTPTMVEFTMTRLFWVNWDWMWTENRIRQWMKSFPALNYSIWIDMKNESFFWLIDLFTNNRVSEHKVTTQPKTSCEIVTVNQTDIMEGINWSIGAKNICRIQSKIMSNSTLTSIQLTQLYHYFTEPQLKLGLQVTCSYPFFVSRFLFALRKLFEKYQQRSGNYLV